MHSQKQPAALGELRWVDPHFGGDFEVSNTTCRQNLAFRIGRALGIEMDASLLQTSQRSRYAILITPNDD